jgi:predicted PurR-regulated permease PerM
LTSANFALAIPIGEAKKKVRSAMETSTDAVPGSDLQQQRKDVAAERLEKGDQLPEDRLEMPWPQEAQTIFQGILCVIALLVCLYIAQAIVLPVVLAIVLKLLLQPLVNLLERLRVPKPVGALIALAVLLSVFVGLGMLLSSPAAQWASELPQAWPQLEQKFAFIKDPIEHIQRTLDQMGVQLESPSALLSNPIGMVTAVFSGTGTVAAHLLETLLVLFYLLVFGETFLRRLVEVLPTFANKREAVEISLHVERDLSGYLLTITVINAAVGCATAGVMWLCDVAAPVLWGVMAFCLNFVPILGPFCGIILFLAVGLISLGPVWAALLPAALYFGIHVIEGEIVTPMLLANRFTINPVAVILSLIFWYWMWGVPGAILAVPTLAIIKIICDRLRPFRAFGHLLEG